MYTHKKSGTRHFVAAIALIAGLCGAGLSVAHAQEPGVTNFWQPWFFNLGGATPGADAPFLEMSGDLTAGTTLWFQCWGLQVSDEVCLVAGTWLDNTEMSSGAVLVPHPSIVLPAISRTYDDDGAGPLPSYTVFEVSMPMSAVPAGPGACFQVWAKSGKDVWTASNAVGASFDLAAK